MDFDVISIETARSKGDIIKNFENQFPPADRTGRLGYPFPACPDGRGNERNYPPGPCGYP